MQGSGDIDEEDLEDLEEESISDIGAKMVLDIGHERTIMNIFHLGRLMVSRSIPTGGIHLIEAIRQTYNLPFGDAQKGLVEKGFILTTREGASQDQIAFSDCIAGALGNLIKEIRLSLLRIRSELRFNVEEIQLTGGASQLLNLSPYLTQQLGVSTNISNYFLDGDIQSDPVFTETSKSSAATAIGLAVEGLRRPRNPAVNLRKEEFGSQSQTFKTLWEKWGTTTKLGLAAFFIFCCYGFVRSTLTDELALAADDALKKQAKAPPVSIKKSSRSNIRKYIRDSKKEVHERKQLAKLASISNVLDVLLDISKAFPKKGAVPFDVRRLYIVNENVIIEGETGSRNQIGGLRSALISVAKDRKVEVLKQPSIRPTPGKVAFAFSFLADRKKDGR
jgi:general secretion pathway protein L